MMDAELRERLDQLDAKLDYVVDRHKMLEELVREMTPIGAEAMTAVAAQLAEFEERGWFALGAEAFGVIERLAATTSPGELRDLGNNLVDIVDTVGHADEMTPMGPISLARIAADEEARRGFTVVVELLRLLGRKGADGEKAPRPERTPPSERPAAATPAPASKSVVHTAVEVVNWEGRRFTSEGFLLDANDWDEALAEKMATGLGITLTPDHWTVIHWIRADHAETGASPNVRRVAAGSGIGTRRLYELFPRTPGKSAAMVSGVPKPVGCV